VAFRSRPRPSSTLDAKASTICPYYLDGDLGRAPKSSAGDTRCHPRLSSTGGCGNCAVFKGRREGCWGRPGDASSASAAHVHPAGRRSLKTQQHAPARDRRDADQAGPGSVDVLGRTVGDRPIPPLAPRGHEAPGTGAGSRTAPCRTGTVLVLPRKEVIQPHLPVRLPCYDFTPVTSPTFDGSLPCGLGHRLRVLLTPVV
jgi:hypothetical protein